MTGQAYKQIPDDPADIRTSRQNFHRILREDLDALYQLSFLLTGNSEQAERCLVTGLEDCPKEHPAFGEWARSWAKRIIVGNAIRALNPRPNHSHSFLPVAVWPCVGQLSSAPSGHFALEAILTLGDFERFVFVMSVLERYSETECARLLGYSVLDIREGRARSLEKLINSLYMLVPDKRGIAQETK